MKEFLGRFKFDPEKSLFVGVERECFLRDRQIDKIVPKAPDVLESLKKGIPKIFCTDSWFVPDGYEPAVPGEFGYELSACQIESRTGPCVIGELEKGLRETEDRLEMLLYFADLRAHHVAVGPEDMPLDVYPDPSGRYKEITKNMPREILLAACRVIGTHIHIGMPDHETALRVYNRITERFGELCEMGNGSFGERLAIYRKMAPDFEPKPYEGWSGYHRTAVEKGFEKDPRRCWTLIRISVHGTIEFRMFDATKSIEKIVGWARFCRGICEEAMAAEEILA